MMILKSLSIWMVMEWSLDDDLEVPEYIYGNGVVTLL